MNRFLDNTWRAFTLGCWTLRNNPTGLIGASRTWADQLRNERFDRESPFPWLPNQILQTIYEDTVILPPRALTQPGNQNLMGLIFLASLAKRIEAKSFFEIGTYNGLTAWTIAQNAPGCTVETLDIPEEASPVLAYGVSDEGNRRNRTVVSPEILPDWDRVNFHLGDSASFDFSPWHNKCDVIYVDGAHSFEYVRSDTSRSMQLTNPGGVIVWDDYWPRIPGVAKFLHGSGLDHLYRVPGTRLVCRINAEGDRWSRGS